MMRKAREWAMRGPFREALGEGQVLAGLRTESARPGFLNAATGLVFADLTPPAMSGVSRAVLDW